MREFPGYKYHYHYGKWAFVHELGCCSVLIFICSLFQLESAYEVAVRDMTRNGINLEWNKIINADQIEQSIAEIKVLACARFEPVFIWQPCNVNSIVMKIIRYCVKSA